MKLKTPTVSSDGKMNGTLCFSPKSYRRTDKPGRQRDGDDDVFLSTDTLMLDLHINPKLRAGVLSYEDLSCLSPTNVMSTKERIDEFQDPKILKHLLSHE